MRISDWSSDVCSSDLRLFGGRPAEGALSPIPCREGQGRHRAYHDRRLRRVVARQPGGLRQPARLQGPDRALAPAAERRLPRARRSGDARKRVVTGDRVSVRVALGGGRIIKKKLKEE